MDVMSIYEGLTNKGQQQENLRRQFRELRQSVHQSMQIEEDLRLKENPAPTEHEIYMGAFREWLEPQVRCAVEEMYKKGYATQSSGFHGERYELQTVDGNFMIDERTKTVLRKMGVEVLRGADIGLPKNELLTMIRFRAREPYLGKIKDQWDAVAAALPAKSFPPGVRPICDRAEEFREQYAAQHPSLEKTREIYIEYLKKQVN
jgi:hypothetical protein